MQIDNYWRKHLKQMNFLRSYSKLRSYGQRDPLVELLGRMCLKASSQALFSFKSHSKAIEKPLKNHARGSSWRPTRPFRPLPLSFRARAEVMMGKIRRDTVPWHRVIEAKLISGLLPLHLPTQVLPAAC